MKAAITLLIGFFMLSISGMAQSIPTIGEIYDFQPGDVFHKRTSPPSIPPRVSRITILDKYYSPTGDTVYYPYRNDSYSTTLVYNPTHLEYSFDSNEGIMSFTNLDSLITTLWYNDTSEYNDTLWSASSYCNVSTITHQYVNWSYVDPKPSNDIYGIGLGMVHLQSIDNETYEYYLYMDVFYYKKGTFECGTPDLTTESILDYSLTEPVYVYPVPFDDEIFIEHYSSSVLKAELMNSQGQIINQCFCPEISTKMATDDLVSGVYFLRISDVQNGQCTYRKLIRM